MQRLIVSERLRVRIFNAHNDSSYISYSLLGYVGGVRKKGLVIDVWYRLEGGQ